MAQLQSTNVVGTLTVNGVAVGGGKDFKYACFTASDSWTPSSDLADSSQFVETHVVGGGGGSGCFYTAVGSGYPSSCKTSAVINDTGMRGYPGAYCVKNVEISSTDPCTITVGAGGSGAVVTSDGSFSVFSPTGSGYSNFPLITASFENGTLTAGGTGGNSCFGSEVVAWGGRGGCATVKIGVAACMANGSYPAVSFTLCDVDSTSDRTNLGFDGYPSTWNIEGKGYGSSNCGFPVDGQIGSNPARLYGFCSGITGREAYCGAHSNYGAFSDCSRTAAQCFMNCTIGTPNNLLQNFYTQPGDMTNTCFGTAPGNGGICVIVCRTGIDARLTYATGSSYDGNDGIVVLKWYE